MTEVLHSFEDTVGAEVDRVVMVAMSVGLLLRYLYA
jgi:hypothetical protein